jgi:hypothetical protein
MHKECLPEKGWAVLKSLKHIFLRHHAILAGGTALALQLGHSISVDLDFFTNEEFKVESVISEIRKTGCGFRIISEGSEHITANIEGIKVSLFKYEYPFLEKPCVYEEVKIAGILDIASMKVIAINQRGTKRDFVDLYSILQDIPFHRIVEHMIKRFGKERLNPIHIGKSLSYFSDAESNPDPEYIKGKSVKWDVVKKFFKIHARQFTLDLDAALKD